MAFNYLKSNRISQTLCSCDLEVSVLLLQKHVGFEGRDKNEIGVSVCGYVYVCVGLGICLHIIISLSQAGRHSWTYFSYMLSAEAKIIFCSYY